MGSSLQPFHSHHRCLVCGEQIHFGFVHDRCKGIVGETNIHGALDKIVHEVRAKLWKEVKHWNKAMGKWKRDELFPDLKGRA